jgi:hypothetical protein
VPSKNKVYFSKLRICISERHKSAPGDEIEMPRERGGRFRVRSSCTLTGVLVVIAVVVNAVKQQLRLNEKMRLREFKSWREVSMRRLLRAIVGQLSG